jgi:hypothetical protein
MGRSPLGDWGLWKLREDGATGGAHEARKRTGRNAGGGGRGSCSRHCRLTVGGGEHAQRGGQRRAGAVYTKVLIVSRDI